MPTASARKNSTAEDLRHKLAELEDGGAHRFKPVRFRFIRAMARRSQEQDPAVAAIVAEKALLALNEYQSDLTRERAEADTLLEQLAESHADAVECARELLAAYDFQGVKRLLGRLNTTRPGNGLSQLLRQLNQVEASTEQSPDSGDLETLLRLQEAAALNVQAGAGPGAGPGVQGPGELRAARHFRDSLARQHADKMVARATQEAPEDSGPLNPQKLAIRSLTAMQGLSPAYLRRFVTYVDTLLWLKKTGEAHKS